MTQPEQKLWRGFLQNYQPRFRRQRMIKTFIVDFYCPATKLVVEVDGESHFTPEGKAKDIERGRGCLRGSWFIRFAIYEHRSDDFV